MRLKYVVMRLARRMLPDFLAYRLFARDLLPVAALAENVRTYAGLLGDYNIPVRGRVIVECGPGTLNSAAFGLFRLGAARILFQEPYLRGRDYGRWKARMLDLWRTLEAHGFASDTQGDVPAPELLLGPQSWNSAFIEWNECPAAATPCPAGSADLVLSHHVLEHIPDVAAVFAEQMRILKPGGWLLHVVDLRDHYFAYPLEMLTFPRFAWERILTSPSRGAGFQNRLRADDYVRLLGNAGYGGIAWRALATDGPELERVRPRLHPEFAGKSREVLAATRIALIARKPEAAVGSEA